MDKKRFEEIVENIFLIVPLLKNKLLKYELNKETDITPSHFRILITLDEMGSMTVSALAKLMGISKPNLTPLIQKLIDKQYLERIIDEKDRRYIYIKLTEVGKKFLREQKDFAIKNLEFRMANCDETDLEKLNTSLQSLKEVLEKI